MSRYEEEEEEEEVEDSEAEDGTSEGTSSSDNEAEVSAKDEEELGADEFKVDEVRIEGLPEPAEGVPTEVRNPAVSPASACIPADAKLFLITPHREGSLLHVTWVCSLFLYPMTCRYEMHGTKDHHPPKNFLKDKIACLDFSLEHTIHFK